MKTLKRKYQPMEKYKTKIVRKMTDKGESIEEMLRRLTASGEPIPQNVPALYTAREDGVIPDTDIRHDRWDTAYEATDKFSRSKEAMSADKGETIAKETTEEKGE